MKLSIIVVAYNHKEILTRCLDSLPHTANTEVIVIDNSLDNQGFSKACNRGAERAGGEYLLFLNPDCVVLESALSEMLQEIKRDNKILVVSPQLVDISRAPYLSYSKQPRWWSAPIVYSFLNDWLRNIPWVESFWDYYKASDQSKEIETATGAALMIRRKDYIMLGGFDEHFFLYWEDMDFSRRVNKTGKQIRYLATAQIEHEGGGVTPKTGLPIKQWFRQSRMVFLKKHFGSFYACLVGNLLSLFEISSNFLKKKTIS